MSNLFEKFVNIDVGAPSAAVAGSKRTGEPSSTNLESKSKAGANTPPFCGESGGTKSVSGSARSRENVSSTRRDSTQKKKNPNDPRLVKRQGSSSEQPPPPPPARQKSNSPTPSSSPQNSSSPPPQQRTYSKRSMHGFTIPKRSDTDKLIRDVDLKSREFLNEILPLLKQSYRFPTSANKLKVLSAQLVRNSDLERKYQEKKQELVSEGRAEKELADCHAFLAVKDLILARKICHEGVRVGNVPFTSLGKPKMGVCLQKHADILGYKFPDTTSYMIIFKTIKGRVKAVPENSVNLEPTPNHDYHVSKNTSLRPTETDIKRLCSATQIYAYEYGDDGVVQRPRHLCPVAIVEYRYGEVSSRKPTNKQSTQTKAGAIRSYVTRATQVWTGQLFNEEAFVSDVRLMSYSILFRPTHITSVIYLTHTIPIYEFKQRYLFNCAHISKQREMHIGSNFLLYMQLHSSEIHSFDQLMAFLDQNNEAGVWYCGQRVECFLIPHTSKANEMGFPALSSRKHTCHCLFVSPYSLASRLAAERGRLAKKAMAVVQQMHTAFGSMQVEGAAAEFISRQVASPLAYAPPTNPSQQADFDQPFFTSCPASSLLKAPVIKAAFEQQALGEDSLLLDKEPKKSTPTKSAESSRIFQSSQHYSSYRSLRAEKALSGGRAALPGALYSPSETLVLLQGGDSTSPPQSSTTVPAPSTAAKYQRSVTGGQHPVLSLDAIATIQDKLIVQSSKPSTLKKRHSSSEQKIKLGPVSPHVDSDNSSRSSNISATRRSSGSSIPYSPTQFSPYEEESVAEDHVSSADITELHKIKFLTLPNCEKQFIGIEGSLTKTSARTRPAVTKRAVRVPAPDAGISRPYSQLAVSSDVTIAQQPKSSTTGGPLSGAKENIPLPTSAGLEAAARTDAVAVAAVKQQETVAPTNDVRKEVKVAKKAVPIAPAKPSILMPKAISAAEIENSEQTNLSDSRALAKKSKLQQTSQVADPALTERQPQLSKRRADSVAEQPTEIAEVEEKRRKQSPRPVKEIPLEGSVTTAADPRIQKPPPASTPPPDVASVKPSQVPVAISRKDGDAPGINLADPTLLKEVLANPTVQEALAKFQEDERKMLNLCLKLPSDLQNLLWDATEEQASLDQHASLIQEVDETTTKGLGGFYFIFGYHDEYCKEAKEFLESDGHRRFDFSDPLSLREVEQGAPLWIFVHASVLPKIYLLPNLVQLKHFLNSHFLLFDIPRQLPERSCTDLMVSGGIIIPDASILLKSPPGILTHVFGLMSKKREVEGPWRMLIHDHILLQLEKLRGVQGLEEHSTTIARAAATLKILVTHHKEQQAHFMYPHACDIEPGTQLVCAKKIQEQHFNTHRHVIIVTDSDPERMTEFVENGTAVVSMIQLINKYLL